MNKKFNKIITTSLITISTAAAIGCATPNSKIATKINNGLNEFVSSINKLDYVDTNSPDSNLGKIVSATNSVKYFADNSNISNIEDTITRPTNRSDNFKLYVLSDLPYISFASDENGTSLNLSMQFSTDLIENTSNDISEKINKLILKRAILMIYVNEIYSGNISLTEENRTAINAYVNVIKENASFLNGNRGMVKNQLGLASNLANTENNNNLINYYIIKSGEALEIRSNKIDSTISAIDSIISILEQNLTSSSCYYQNNLTNTYNNIINNLQNENSTDENNKLAKSIAESISFDKIETTNNSTTENNSISETNQNNTINSDNTTNNQTTITPPITTLNNTNNTINNSNITSNNELNNPTTTNMANDNNITNTQNQEIRNRRRRRRRNNPNYNPENTPTNPTTRPERLQENNSNIAQTSIITNEDNHASTVPYKVNK